MILLNLKVIVAKTAYALDYPQIYTERLVSSDMLDSLDT